MKKKQYELLDLLLRQSRPFTSNELAEELHVSVRSIKNYVRDMNRQYHKKIIYSSRNGYEVNKQAARHLLSEQKAEKIPQTNEERASYIIKQLILQHTQQLNIFDLCETLCIGYSTVKTILCDMNKSYAAYHIRFSSEKNHIQLLGTEKDKRKLISYIINEESKNSYIDTTLLKNCFPELDVASLSDIINQTFKNHKYYLNDFAYINLLMHLVIIIDREKKGNSIEFTSEHSTIDQSSELLFVNDLCRQIEDFFFIQLDQYERYEIYTLIRSNANYSLPSSSSELSHLVGDDILNLTTCYVHDILNLYFIDLSSEAFTTPFSLHLKNLIYRAALGKFMKNPLANSIKFSNPIVFDIAIYIGLDIMERYQIDLNEDELAFLAMHIGAEIERQNQSKTKLSCVLLCPSYHDLSETLLNNLRLNFGTQIDIQRTIHKEEELQHLSFQLLLTTDADHKAVSNYHTICIHPFQLSKDYPLIQETILMLQQEYKNQILRDHFHTFFDANLFIVKEESCDKAHMIDELCDMLELNHYVTAEFRNNIVKREKAATTAFGDIAIPHSMDMDALKTSVVVAISNQGISWDTNNVHIVLLLAINKADKKMFRELYESLINIFSDDQITQEVKSIHCFLDFKKLIFNYLNRSILDH